MITTATGLVTAICALSCGRWFEHLSVSRLRDMGFVTSVLGEKFRRDILGGAAKTPRETASATAERERQQNKESA
jgi:hypothetical protein